VFFLLFIWWFIWWCYIFVYLSSSKPALMKVIVTCYLSEWLLLLLVYKSEKTSPITRIQINQSSVIERKGIYSNISEINKNKQYILSSNNSSRIELLWFVWDQSRSKYYLRTKFQDGIDKPQKFQNICYHPMRPTGDL
jgi:hypothetical protein